MTWRLVIRRLQYYLGDVSNGGIFTIHSELPEAKANLTEVCDFKTFSETEYR